MDRRGFFYRLFGSGILSAAITTSLRADPGYLSGRATPKVKWQKNMKAAQKLATQQDKPVLIVFGASWCAFCHKLEKETLTDKRVASLIEREFIPVHLDFNKDEKTAKILDVERLPCVVILSPNMDLLSKNEGFSEPKEFQALLNSALEKRDQVQQVKAAESRDSRQPITNRITPTAQGK